MKHERKIKRNIKRAKTIWVVVSFIILVITIVAFIKLNQNNYFNACCEVIKSKYYEVANLTNVALNK
jgi:hypothetical protein